MMVEGMVVDNICARRNAQPVLSESRNLMLEMKEAALGTMQPGQAADLSLLVDLEARWENLRKTPAPNVEASAATLNLLGRQKAYEAYRVKLKAYNDRHTPAHVPELLLNNSTRLGAWCRRMRDLYRQVENDSRTQCPVHLLEKAYRWADRLSSRLNKDSIGHSAPPATIAAAIQELDALAKWCEELDRAANTMMLQANAG